MASYLKQSSLFFFVLCRILWGSDADLWLLISVRSCTVVPLLLTDVPLLTSKSSLMDAPSLTSKSFCLLDNWLKTADYFHDRSSFNDFREFFVCSIINWGSNEKVVSFFRLTGFIKQVCYQDSRHSPFLFWQLWQQQEPSSKSIIL